MMHTQHVIKLAQSLVSYISDDDGKLDRDTFLKYVADRILDDLQALSQNERRASLIDAFNSCLESKTRCDEWTNVPIPPGCEPEWNDGEYHKIHNEHNKNVKALIKLLGCQHLLISYWGGC